MSLFALGAAVTADELDRDPHPVLAQLREHEPVSWVPALGGWLITRHDLALAVMRDAVAFTVQDDRFSTGRVLGPSMLSTDGIDHSRHRAPFVAPFRPTPVRERFAAAVGAECERLIDRLAPRGGAELLSEFAGPLAAGVLTRALGFDAADAPQVRGWYEGIVAAVSALSAGESHDTDTAAAGRAAYAALASRLAEVMADHGRDSLLAAAAHDADGTLTVAELAADAGVLLFGGIETTEAMIASAVLHVLRSPETAARLSAATADREPTVAAAVEESLRLEPAAAMVDRYATTDVEIAGAHLAAGDLVHVSLTAANRDPAVFDDPDRFRIDPPRPPRHLAFAQGPHVCLGIHLARLEARAALTRLFERLPGFRLDPEYPAAVRGIVFRKPAELHVRWDIDTR